jgi:uncharacterized 2Fe-2S/4Fe-4S cluster protein (DUF4445 family)
MPQLSIVFGPEEKTIEVEEGVLLGDVIQAVGLPIEQPCAGRGTCGKCKVIVEEGLIPTDEVEQEHLTAGELALNSRLACRARVSGDARVILSKIVVYSNKIFKASSAYKRNEDPLGLAIDLGSTTVAAFLTNLKTGEVYRGEATLNQQTTFGSDIISRIDAAVDDHENAKRLHMLALASINQAVDSLKLAKKFSDRIQKVTIVGNVAMHHLLARLPVTSLAAIPFQPAERASRRNASEEMEGIFPSTVQVSLPPLIGGFVGSDALACLAYFGFENAVGPMAAIDLGTNGEVLVTDGERILVTSTAAGPAFEGVNISCGTRAVDGAVVDCKIEDKRFIFKTIGDEPPIGLTGSGLLSTIHELVKVGILESNGRINPDPPVMKDRMISYEEGLAVRLDPNGEMLLTQWDVRELQKAKGAIRAAMNILMNQLNVRPKDLKRLILTGSFGGQIDINAAVKLGLIPPAPIDRIETIANGAGFGAAIFLSEPGFALGERLAAKAEQVDLDQDPDFVMQYVDSMGFPMEELS